MVEIKKKNEADFAKSLLNKDKDDEKEPEEEEEDLALGYAKLFKNKSLKF